MTALKAARKELSDLQLAQSLYIKHSDCKKLMNDEFSHLRIALNHKQPDYRFIRRSLATMEALSKQAEDYQDRAHAIMSERDAFALGTEA